MQQNLKTFSKLLPKPLPKQRRLIALAVAGACASFVPAHAQQVAAPVPGDVDGPN